MKSPRSSEVAVSVIPRANALSENSHIQRLRVPREVVVADVSKASTSPVHADVSPAMHVDDGSGAPQDGSPGVTSLNLDDLAQRNQDNTMANGVQGGDSAEAGMSLKTSRIRSEAVQSKYVQLYLPNSSAGKLSKWFVLQDDEVCPPLLTTTSCSAVKIIIYK